MSHNRQKIFLILISAVFAGLLVRLYYLQVMNHRRFTHIASSQHNTEVKIPFRRGIIYDRHTEPLAINLDAVSIFCDPRHVGNKEEAASRLSGLLGMERDAVLRKILRGKGFAWIKRKADKRTADRVREAGLDGVFFIEESKRRYPNDSLAANLIGFAGMDNKGLEGLELAYDEMLSGRCGSKQIIRDARQRAVLFRERESIPPVNGSSIVLTIDAVIQYIVEEELRKISEDNNVRAATAVVMEPVSGEILAMATYPSYDLNEYYKAPRDTMKNHAVSTIFEPGSVFKVFTASASLAEGVVEPGDIIFCENGEYEVRRRVLHDYHAYGDLTFEEVIIRSSNIGTVKTAMELGPEELYGYIKDFGFGRKTGIDIIGEVSGISRHPDSWSISDITTIPIGQGIAVTAVQLARAVSVIANGGALMRPYVVKTVLSHEGEVIKKFGPVTEKIVLSPETCDIMKDIMQNVVTDGTGRFAFSEKYDLCGKTGTAQMVDPGGGYYDNKYNATFLGFAPKQDPAVSIVVAAFDPHPSYFGGTVSGPAFKRIAERVLEYLGVPKKNIPDRNGNEEKTG
jgi:cell division protein FtsI/penicillin-binding protein 2